MTTNRSLLQVQVMDSQLMGSLAMLPSTWATACILQRPRLHPLCSTLGRRPGRSGHTRSLQLPHTSSSQ
jgi:hypothetical protein